MSTLQHLILLMKQAKKKIHIIVGARPNFIKLFNLIKCLDKIKNIRVFLIHTGQHYSSDLNNIFFNELKIRKPDFQIKSGSGNHAEQHAKVMINYQKIINNHKADLCFVIGDVNSTISCALIAKKNNIKVAHIESGLRSFDNSMPEEINRVLTDSISDYHFVTLKSAYKNLINEGVKKNKIFFVGNTMIDTLMYYKDHFVKSSSNLKKKYVLITLHRPSNVDNIKKLNLLLKKISMSFQDFEIIFPAHPRTFKQINKKKMGKNITLIKPMSYLRFMTSMFYSSCVITDSGGISEESSFLNIPCITIRANTERPETINLGTNVLIDNNLGNLNILKKRLINKKWKKTKKFSKWDGQASKRIANIIENKILL